MTRNFFDLKFEKATPGQIIKAFRKNFEITLQELSKATGIAVSNLSAIENDKIDIGVKRAVLIAAFFGLEPSLILFPNGYEAYSKETKKVQEAAAKIMSKKQKIAAG